MAVIEYDEYKQKLQALEPTLRELEKALGIPKDRQELKNLQAETEQEASGTTSSTARRCPSRSSVWSTASRSMTGWCLSGRTP